MESVKSSDTLTAEWSYFRAMNALVLLVSMCTWGFIGEGNPFQLPILIMFIGAISVLALTVALLIAMASDQATPWWYNLLITVVIVFVAVYFSYFEAPAAIEWMAVCSASCFWISLQARGH
jgi:hypothetical protein